VKRVWQALAVLGVLVVVGTIGYHTLEDMTILDALYMTVTTISTVGFGEVHPRLWIWAYGSPDWPRTDTA
jgi:Ion channel